MALNEIVVLGAGIAGISALFHLRKRGLNAIGFEALNIPGGLVSNFKVGEFRFDNAIHMSFTKDEYVRSLFDETEYYSHSPEPHCYEKDKWLKHPVQNNLFPLTVNEKVELIGSFMSRPCSTPRNYRQWLIFQYGQAIAERYPILYTRKYWGLEPDRLSLTWIGNRIRQSDPGEVLRGAFEARGDNHYYAEEMRYPKSGGYFSFVEPMLNGLDIKCGYKVESIDINRKIITFTNKFSVQYESLISSLPLPVIVELIVDCPNNVKDAARSLLYTSVDLVSLGFSKQNIPPYLWFYIYDEDIIPARGYSPSWKSPQNAPQGCSSLQFEIYTLSGKPKPNPEMLVQHVKDKIVTMNICSRADIIIEHHKRLLFGNIVFDEGMEVRRRIVLSYLNEIGVISCGRFGEWDYFWSDQSLLSGKRSADSLASRI